MTKTKSNILLIGAGGVGTIAALNLESGGLANVTAVLRSNYDIVTSKGFDIESCDHGTVKGWRPSQVLRQIPTNETKFDYIICTTKNIFDCPPTTVDLLKPAVTLGHTVIVLIQNGLNIEQPFFSAFPQNIVLSGTSMIGSSEIKPGVIQHSNPDLLILGAFRNPLLDPSAEDAAASHFHHLYTASGKAKCNLEPDVAYSRWRKLIYNACLNSTAALTGLDTGRLRLADGTIDTLVRPAMEEIRAAAASVGIDLPAELVDQMINVDPLTSYYPPSMLLDVRRGNLTELESIVGEPLRVGQKNGVSMPVLSVLYNLLKANQWRTKEQKGLVGPVPTAV